MNPGGNHHGGQPMYGGGGPPPHFMPQQQQFDISRSTLRATATEFVPNFLSMQQTSFPPPQHHSHHQPPQHQHQQPHHMPPHQRHQGPPPHQMRPRHHQPHSYHHPPPEQQQPQEAYMSTMYMFRHGNAQDRIKEAIKLLIDNPGNFEEIMPDLTQSLTTCISNENALLCIVNELFQQSVRENNFRYTGARMCNYFTHHLNVSLPGRDFRKHLLIRCQEEYEKRDSLLSEATTHAHFIGFTLFLGELLLNMTDVKEEKRVEVLVPLVHQLINLLMDRTEEKFLRCAVQVLKLTGAILSDLEKASNEGNTPQVDAIFVKIRAGLLDENFSRSIKNMLLGVVELRAKDWGRMEPDPKLNPQQANPYLNQNAMAMSGPPMPPPEQFMYPPMGMDGNHVPPMFNNQGDFIPQEFLEAGGDPLWSNPEDSEYYDYLMFAEGDYPTYSQDDEFDDEIAAAYEEFMRDNNQHHH